MLGHFGIVVPLLPGGTWQAAALLGLFLLVPLCCRLLCQQAVVLTGQAAQVSTRRAKAPVR